MAKNAPTAQDSHKPIKKSKAKLEIKEVESAESAKSCLFNNLNCAAHQ